MVADGGSHSPILQLHDTGGLSVDRYGDKLQFTIFEWQRGSKVGRAQVILTLEGAVELIKLLCKQCGVEMVGTNGEKL